MKPLVEVHVVRYRMCGQDGQRVVDKVRVVVVVLQWRSHQTGHWSEKMNEVIITEGMQGPAFLPPFLHGLFQLRLDLPVPLDRHLILSGILMTDTRVRVIERLSASPRTLLSLCRDR